MNPEAEPYAKLQKHLDAQAVGFPGTRKKAEIKVLQYIFKPDHAKMALNLTYQFETVETILTRVQTGATITMTRKQLEQILDQMALNRSIIRRVQNNEKQYALLPLLVGMYEFQLGKLNTDFLNAMDAYTSTLQFGLAFIGTEYSQMRTIPVEQSITPEHQILNYNDLSAIIRNSPGPFVINKCICLEKHQLQGRLCKTSKREERCLAIGDMAQQCMDIGIGRVISKEEAFEIEHLNEDDGLVLEPEGAQNPEYICACCGCCCGMLSTLRDIPRPADFWTTDYFSRVDPSLCKGCGLCVKRCNLNAVKLIESEHDPQKKMASVNITRCIGCGLCVVKCATHAITLVRKANPIHIPKDHEELYDEIKRKRKTKWQLLKTGLNLIRGKKWH